ncbi:MAG: polysaccharide deacetylase family protein [Crocinitomicaceae bacterium]|nr:polysaccharide deacetylase family protein [Crocinitomicaceae bacterium]
MLTILVDKITPRIEYTFDFIFSDRGVLYRFVTEIVEFEKASQPKLNYSASLNSSVSSLLYETGIVQKRLNKYGFRLRIDEIDDKVASIFFVLSRYEEYIDEKDIYGRFPFSKSILGRDWVELAVCDRWAVDLIKELSLNYIPRVVAPELKPTFDIDNTYAYRLKKGKRRMMSIFKDILTLKFSRIKERQSVLRGKKKDPYDTFDIIRDIGEKFISTKVFWLVGKWAKKDRNIGVDVLEHQRLIKDVSLTIDIGLHPSFASFKRLNVIKEEKNNLDSILEGKTLNSRQHFLRFRLPDTYQQLISAGFKNEYSMGFAEHVGFRAGTARSHDWFNLKTNERTDFRIHPFVYMDGTLREYMKLDVNQSKEKINQLYEEVATFGGDFTFIWHNETIGDYGLWNGWYDVLNFTLKLNNE